jgi:murein L,D-transpeptidase YafK
MPLSATDDPTQPTGKPIGKLFNMHAPIFRACVALIALMLIALAPVHAAGGLSIELKDVAPDRVERQRAAALGALPLPGTPDLSSRAERLAAKGLKPGDPIFMRIFKSESLLELWMRKDDGRFVLFETYPICHWSGTIGPKVTEGDKQNPEGFYTVTRSQLHLIGRWPRSLNLGFPNPYDKALGRNGSYILVHGGCTSVGCFAMTNAVIAEIYDLAEAALKKGQQTHIHVHAFPFRMTDEAMKANASSQWIAFWTNLKEGYDAFDQTRVPPRVGVCDKRYSFQADGPLEVAGQSPLAVCGATVAAIQEMGRSRPFAMLRGAALRQASARLLSSRVASNPTGALPIPLSSNSPPTATLLPEARTAAVPPLPGRSSLGGPLATMRQQAGAALGTQPPCDLARVSCRRWTALQLKAASKRGDTAARSTSVKRSRSASR